MGKEKKEEKDKKDKKEKKEKKDKKDKKDKKLGKEKMAMKASRPKLSAQSGPTKVKKHLLKGKMKGKLAKSQQKGPAPPKAITKSEEDYEPVNRWWELEDGALSGKRGAKKWDTFEHHGLMFAPDYEPHGVPMRYDGKQVKLSLEAEEIATYWTSVKGTD